jgi:hypothetical protein
MWSRNCSTCCSSRQSAPGPRPTAKCGGWLARLTHPSSHRRYSGSMPIRRRRAGAIPGRRRDVALVLAALFKAVAGAPPLTYITTWRIVRSSCSPPATDRGSGRADRLWQRPRAQPGIQDCHRAGTWTMAARVSGCRRNPGPVKPAALGSVTKAVKRSTRSHSAPRIAADRRIF